MMNATRVFEQMYRLVAGFGMEAVYMAMLLGATSKRDLRERHNALPDNTRLLRNDYLDLERAWEVVHNDAMRDAILALALAKLQASAEERVAGHACRYGYYVWKAEEGRKQVQAPHGHEIHSRKWRRVEDRAFFVSNFTACMCTSPARVEMYLYNRGVYVRMIVAKTDLTEPLVHALRQAPALCIEPFPAGVIAFSITLTERGLKDLVAIEQGLIASGGLSKYFFGDSRFRAEIERCLRKHNVPIEKIQPTPM